MNRCGSEAWLDIELGGPPENSEGLGARLVADLGDRVLLRELYNLRGTGQGPSRFHLGLGSLETVPGLSIVWPDGEESRAEAVPTRRHIVFRHSGASSKAEP